LVSTAGAEATTDAISRWESHTVVDSKPTSRGAAISPQNDGDKAEGGGGRAWGREGGTVSCGREAGVWPASERDRSNSFH
jgi:hypothetical protein